MPQTPARLADRLRRRAPTADLALALALWLLGWAEIGLSHHPRLWPDAFVATAMTLPIAARRTIPLLGTLGISAGLAVLVASGEKTSQYLFALVGVLVALYSLGSYGAIRPRLFGLAVALAATVTSASVQKGHGASDAIFAAGVVAVPWAVGLVSHRRERATSALRERAEQLELEQVERERAAVAAERDRIARELHDIVAHSVTLMVLQANAGERQLDADPRAAHEAFGVIRESGKSALAELRRMLDLLHGDAPQDAVRPQPSLEDVVPLVDRSRRAGMSVSLHFEPGEDVPESVAVAAYRVIQEALTNANRHAHGAHVDVSVAQDGDGLRVVVHNGEGRRLADTPGSGYGLAGMRERVKVFGGRLMTATTPERGFRVEVVLPLERAS